jgi:hypothetical protein
MIGIQIERLTAWREISIQAGRLARRRLKVARAGIEEARGEVLAR